MARPVPHPFVATRHAPAWLAIATLLACGEGISSPTDHRSGDAIPAPVPQLSMNGSAQNATAHFIPLVNQNAPHVLGSTWEFHKQSGGGSVHGTAELTDDGTTLSVAVNLSGLIPAPMDRHDLYTLVILGPAVPGAPPVNCLSRPRIRNVFDLESSDSNGQIARSFSLTGSFHVPLGDIGALALLFDDATLSCGPLVGN